MRRPWVIVVVAFAVVIAAGGLALAMPGVLDHSASDKPVADTFAAAEGESFEAPASPSPEALRVEAPATDTPKSDEPAEETPPKDTSPPEEPKNDEPAPEPPHFEITWPTDGEHVGDRTIRFEGMTEPGVAVTAGKYQADVDAEGNWGIVLVLQPGGNQASFRAVNEAGDVAEASVKVFYDAPEEPSVDEEKPPKEDEEHTWEFWAKQKYGSCGENPPYDVFFGGTAPNATVEVSSPFGSGSTVAGEKGGWDIKVIFAEAPVNEPFVITVTSEGHSKQFEFIRIDDPEAGVEK